jgi:hypothetical protein
LVPGRRSLALLAAVATACALGAAPAGAAPDGAGPGARVDTLRGAASPFGLLSLYGRPRLAGTPAPLRADASYQDTVGDAEGGLAPDIAAVVVADDPDGTIRFGIDYANRVCTGAGDFAAVFVDSDRNPATGSYGADVALAIDAGAGTVGAFRWDGAAYRPFGASTLRAACDAAGGIDVIAVGRADLGVGAGFAFDVSTQFEQGPDRFYDQAPDSGTWSYELSASEPPPAACADGLDNDGDAAVDFPLDPGCSDTLDTDETDAAEPPPLGKTYRSAPGLPRRDAYTGAASVKHEKLTSIVYRTMKSIGSPRTLAIACWAEVDWDSVLSSLGVEEEADTVLLGFWLSEQPRWLHLSPGTCANVQRLLSTKRVNGPRARAFTTVLHETLHAYGVRIEAKTNCYATQLVPLGGRALGLSEQKARSLGRLAVTETRAGAPAGYWDATRCRDGGAWDLRPGEPNLR